MAVLNNIQKNKIEDLKQQQYEQFLDNYNLN